MSAIDKARTRPRRRSVLAKEKVGAATRDESLEAEGKAAQTKGNLKVAGEKIKDAFDN